MYEKKHLRKSKLNRFYVTIKIRLDVAIFQQQIIWEELFQINDMGDNFSRGTFGMEYYCHIFSKYLVFQMKNLVFPSQNLAF